ncbi:serine/threonine-protein kinase [Larkinella rosea]|uniref:Serine/threonine protein kinase n=1 Tax=Larkinella rosea TaxID=2025312 RepID=A0A3P1BA92_9BACT|nr:serine/threonine-protein kinase [Larkinella rosea]RRA97945.1 serine/threonine protein kinase [Larkinella rosea]
MTYEEFRNRYHYEPGKLSSPENDEDFGRLGEGGFGSVFKGWDTIENQWVAIKVSNVRTEQRDLSLKREVELANQIPRHANIARYEVCERFTTVFGVVDMAVLKYYKEGNLAELLLNKTLTQSEKDDIITGILSGLAHLHRHQMAHRDLKPQNILVARTPYGKYVPLITDFGLSKIVRPDDNLVMSMAFLNSTIAGSVYYMAPEQLKNGRMHFNVDLWAFGVILYELMTGKKPFIADSEAGSETERIQIIQRINEVAIPAQFDRIPEPYQTVIRQCLVHDIDQRVQKAETLLRILSPLEPEPIEPPVILPPVVTAYDEQRSFSEGYAAVRIGPRWGLVNTAGTLVVPVEFDSITDIEDKKALVRKQGQASRILVNGDTYQLVQPGQPRQEARPMPVPPPPVVLPAPVPLPGPAPLRKDAYFPIPPVLPSSGALRQAYIVVAVGIGLILFGLLLLSMVSNGVFSSNSDSGYGSYNAEPNPNESSSGPEKPVFGGFVSTQLVKGQDFTVEVPRSMQSVTNLRDGAEVQYSNPGQELYLVVFTERVADVEANKIYNLDQYRNYTTINSETFRTRSQSDVGSTDEGMQYIIRDVDYVKNGKSIPLYCINGFYKSSDKYYQVFAWTLKSNQSDFETDLLHIVRSFRLS